MPLYYRKMKINNDFGRSTESKENFKFLDKAAEADFSLARNNNVSNNRWYV